MLINDRNRIVAGSRFDIMAEEVIEYCQDEGMK
jgi:hypothetical protein